MGFPKRNGGGEVLNPPRPPFRLVPGSGLPQVGSCVDPSGRPNPCSADPRQCLTYGLVLVQVLTFVQVRARPALGDVTYIPVSIGGPTGGRRGVVMSAQLRSGLIGHNRGLRIRPVWVPPKMGLRSNRDTCPRTPCRPRRQQNFRSRSSPWGDNRHRNRGDNRCRGRP